jgi:hypothetical protein
VRDLRRTALVSVPAYSRFPEKKVGGPGTKPKPVSFNRLGRVPAREQIIHCLISTGERKP